MSAEEPKPTVELDTETKLRLYHFLKLGRALEDRLFILYRQGRIPGAVYLGRGQEAITIGCSSALQDGDVVWGTHRDVLTQLPRGMSVERIMANHLGKVTGPTRGKDGNTHLGDLSLGLFSNVSMLPDGYPVIAGAALAFKLRGEARVGLALCGEGATSRGDWHEALNFAAVHQLPAVFVVENNKFAYSTPNRLEFKVELVKRAEGYGIPGESIYGNDVELVYGTAKAAVNRARAGGGPTLIICDTMRMLGHAGHDPFKYVPKDLLSEWEQQDPVLTFERRLLEEGVISESERDETHARVAAEVEAALAEAEESPYPQTEEVTAGVYAGGAGD